MNFWTAYWFVVRHYWLLSAVSLLAVLVFLGIGFPFGYPGIAAFGLVLVGIPMAFLLIFGGFKRIFDLTPPPGEKLLFSESWASGHSNRNFFTKIGGARNGLTVQVSEGFLYIRPFLMAAHVADVGGMLHKIPLRSIMRCEKQANQVFLEWNSEGDKSFVLRLRRPDEFVGVLEGARRAIAK
jgi:hypothetical protein